MRMDETRDNPLIQAIRAYDYPAVTFDFVTGRARRFPSMIELEGFVQSLLLSEDMQSLKNGLSAVLYWGHYRAPYRDHRVKRFREGVTDGELQRAIGVLRTLEGTALTTLCRLGLPEFGAMAFTTKLRTFLDPEHYCVLDKKIASLPPLNIHLKRYPTYIPVNEQNEEVYERWVNTCSHIASSLQMSLRPVDVERGFFALIDHRNVRLAERLLQAWWL